MATRSGSIVFSGTRIGGVDLPNLWRADDSLDRADCLSCNACVPMGPDPLRCVSKATPIS